MKGTTMGYILRMVLLQVLSAAMLQMQMIFCAFGKAS